jgi:hypothetical protein
VLGGSCGGSGITIFLFLFLSSVLRDYFLHDHRGCPFLDLLFRSLERVVIGWTVV